MYLGNNKAARTYLFKMLAALNSTEWTFQSGCASPYLKKFHLVEHTVNGVDMLYICAIFTKTDIVNGVPIENKHCMPLEIDLNGHAFASNLFQVWGRGRLEAGQPVIRGTYELYTDSKGKSFVRTVTR